VDKKNCSLKNVFIFEHICFDQGVIWLQELFDKKRAFWRSLAVLTSQNN